MAGGRPILAAAAFSGGLFVRSNCPANSWTLHWPIIGGTVTCVFARLFDTRWPRPPKQQSLPNAGPRVHLTNAVARYAGIRPAPGFGGSTDGAIRLRCRLPTTLFGLALYEWWTIRWEWPLPDARAFISANPALTVSGRPFRKTVTQSMQVRGSKVFRFQTSPLGHSR